VRLSLCLSVCLSARISQKPDVRTSPNFLDACRPWPLIGLSLAPLQHVMYFRFCGWRHDFLCPVATCRCRISLAACAVVQGLPLPVLRHVLPPSLEESSMQGLPQQTGWSLRYTATIALFSCISVQQAGWLAVSSSAQAYTKYFVAVVSSLIRTVKIASNLLTQPKKSFDYSLRNSDSIVLCICKRSFVNWCLFNL